MDKKNMNDCAPLDDEALREVSGGAGYKPHVRDFKLGMPTEEIFPTSMDGTANGEAVTLPQSGQPAGAATLERRKENPREGGAIPL